MSSLASDFQEIRGGKWAYSGGELRGNNVEQNSTYVV
jgi:hypothetical protein